MRGGAAAGVKSRENAPLRDQPEVGRWGADDQTPRADGGWGPGLRANVLGGAVRGVED